MRHSASVNHFISLGAHICIVELGQYLNQNTKKFIDEYAFEDVIREVAIIFPGEMKPKNSHIRH